jgi:hypothetical protein
MRTIIVIILLLLQTIFSYSQNATEEAKSAIEDSFNSWVEKGEFEKNSDYEARIKKSDKQLQIITDSVINSIKDSYLQSSFAGILKEYNADDETYLMYLYHGEKYAYDNNYKQKIVIKVDPQIASELRSRIEDPGAYLYTYAGIKVIPNDIAIINDEWTITDALIIFYLDQRDGSVSTDKIVVTKKSNDVYCKMYSYSNKEKGYRAYDLKKCSSKSGLPDSKSYLGDPVVYCFYNWSMTDQPDYTPSSTEAISFTFDELNVFLPEQDIKTTNENETQHTHENSSQTEVKNENKKIESLVIDVKTKNKNPNAFAIVIGNKDYDLTKDVDFAINDAKSIKNYLVNVMGYSEGNIFYIENATKSNLETYFGTKENPEAKLFNNIKQGISDVFVYYSGHGAPGLKDNKGYIVPIDCDPQYVEQGGYSLDLLYSNISKLNAKSVTIITDACFSGAEIFKNISPIVITVSNPIVLEENCVILSSSTGAQVSCWYNEKQHGMFTYFFLYAIKDKNKSDTNKDNKLSLKEIFDYVSDKTEGVPYYARSIHGVEQTPSIQGSGIDNIFIEYK